MCLIELITGERVLLLLAAEDGGDKVTSTVAFEGVNVEKFRVLHTCCWPDVFVYD